MWRDVTAELLGDPGSQPRRVPTEQEIERSRRPLMEPYATPRKKSSPIYDWKIGEGKLFATRGMARSAQNQLYIKGMLGAARKTDTGFLVTRTF